MGTTVPNSILISQLGGLGDVVLVGQLVSWLKRSFPQAQITLICPSRFACVPDLFPVKPDVTLGLDFDPYAWSVPSAELHQALAPVVEQLRSLRADCFIAGEYQPTWFSFFAGACVTAETSLCATHRADVGALLPAALDHFGLEAMTFSGPVVDAGIHELYRYREL